MIRSLEEAHVTIFDGYTFEHDDALRRKRLPIHAILPDLEQRAELSAKVEVVLSATQQAFDDPDNQTRFGYHNVNSAWRSALEESELSEGTLAKIAVSELDPAWLVEAQTEEVVALAGLMSNCRALAKLQFQIGVWHANSD